MRYASFRRPDGQVAFGEAHGDLLVERSDAPDLAAMLAAAPGRPADGGRHAVGSVDFLPPIPAPGKIICIGLNYRDHQSETGLQAGDRPTVFIRFADTLVGHGAPLLCPTVSHRFDFEGELAVVIGRPGRAISRAAAFDHVAGYACFNDGSIRDWQGHSSQFTAGKNFPSTGSFGPWLVTPDEVDLATVQVVTRLNQAVVQDQPVTDLIFPIDELIAYVSAFTPLRAGDVIATGTPGGVGMARTPRLWMKPGDVVEVEIDRVGLLRNPVASEAQPVA